MLQTWKVEPDERPGFSLLVAQMGDFLEANVKQVEENSRVKFRSKYERWRVLQTYQHHTFYVHSFMCMSLAELCTERLQ